MARPCLVQVLTGFRLYCAILIEQWDASAVLQIDPKAPMPIYAQLERLS